MCARFCPLSSGSKGNCLYLQTPESTFLIDLGISLKKLQERLQEIGASIDEIDGILISHEHTDHISGLKVFCEKKEVPILANAETAKGIYRSLGSIFDFKIFTSNEPFSYKGIHVDPFTIQHDTLDPVGFVISFGNRKIGICSDLGIVSSLVKMKLQLCDILYIEANHDVNQVHSSTRPDTYKQRVLSRQGHLSNEECALLIKDVHHENLQHVYLAHLSSECNSPQRALATIEEILQKEKKKVNLSIAYQEKVSHICVL